VAAWPPLPPTTSKPLRSAGSAEELPKGSEELRYPELLFQKFGITHGKGIGGREQLSVTYLFREKSTVLSSTDDIDYIRLLHRFR